MSDIGSIDVKIIRNDKNEIIERRLYIVDNAYMQSNQYPYMQNCTYPIRKKVKDNIINNKIDRLFNYVIKKERRIPNLLKDFNINKINDVLERFGMNYTKDMIDIFTKENLERIKIIVCTLVELTIMNKNLNAISRERLFVIYDKCKKNNTEIANFYDYYLISVMNELYKL